MQQASGYFAVATGISQIDSPAFSLADLLSLGLLGAGATVCLGIATHNVLKEALSSVSVSQTKEEENAAAVTQQPSATVIYRYGGTNPGNFVPSEKDVLFNSGLSFSTIPKKGAAVTTIEALNATGVVFAV